MQTRETRYRLRFESGDREGEELPLGSPVNSAGRRAENEIVIAHGSVSGRHAELHVDPKGVELVDLGSTNGTRVGGKRIQRVRLAHGDLFSLGSVKFSLIDNSILPGVGTTRPSATPIGLESDPDLDSDPGAGGVTEHMLEHISAERMASSAKTSRGGLLILPVLAVLAAGAFFGWRYLRAGPTGKRTVVVEAVPGNLLAEGSFEGEDSAWRDLDAAPQLFGRDTGYEKSGLFGLGVALGPNEWGLARSPEFELRSRRAVELRASLWAEGEALARIGLELSSTTSGGPPILAWAPAIPAADGFEEVVLGFDVLPGYDRGCVVVAGSVPAASAEGVVSLDDVSVVFRDSKGAAASYEENAAFPLGDSASTSSLVRSGRVIIPEIRLDSWGDDGLDGWPFARWSAEKTEDGLTFSCAGAPADAVLEFSVSPRPSEGGSDDLLGEGWIATIGPDGFRSHATEFETEHTKSLLLGRGIDLLRVGFDEPVALKGAVSEGVLWIRAPLKGLSGFHLQLDFQTERGESRRLEVTAREAERAGDFGAALEAWSRLLNDYPFDAELVRAAEDGRARLVQDGLERLDSVRQEVERARFFELPDLYRQCRLHAEAVAESYLGTDVETEAKTLLAEIEAELDLLATGSVDERRTRLEAVLQALGGEEAPSLAEHVRGALGKGPEDQ